MTTKKTANKTSAKEEFVWCTIEEGYVSESFNSVDACLKDAQRNVGSLSRDEEVLIYKLVAKASVVTKLELAS